MSSHVIFDPLIASKGDSSTIELTIDKTEEIGESITLKSEIYNNRFNKNPLVNTDSNKDSNKEEDYPGIMNLKTNKRNRKMR